MEQEVFVSTMFRILIVLVIVGIVAMQGEFSECIVHFHAPEEPMVHTVPCFLHSVLHGLDPAPRLEPVLQQGKAGRGLPAQVRDEQPEVRLAGGGYRGHILHHEGRRAVLHEAQRQAALGVSRPYALFVDKNSCVVMDEYVRGVYAFGVNQPQLDAD